MKARVGVVGHVEWVQFAVVDHYPAPGEIVVATEWFEEAAGSGSVASVQLRKLGGEATFFCALGDDDAGARARRERPPAHRGGAAPARVSSAAFCAVGDSGATRCS